MVDCAAMVKALFEWVIVILNSAVPVQGDRKA